MQEIDQRVFYNNTLMEDRGTRILEGEFGQRKIAWFFFSFFREMLRRAKFFAIICGLCKTANHLCIFWKGILVLMGKKESVR